MNKILKQIELQNKIKKLAKVNIVTCGNCGSIVLHELDDNEIDCPYCNRIMDVSDCPDYLYDGMENNEVY
jgi:rubrerythrin